jgi:hypothetical protein
VNLSGFHKFSFATYGFSSTATKCTHENGRCNQTYGKILTVFWDVAPCSLVETDRRFRGAYCLYHQGDANRLHGAESLKTAIIIIVAVRN